MHNMATAAVMAAATVEAMAGATVEVTVATGLGTLAATLADTVADMDFPIIQVGAMWCPTTITITMAPITTMAG